jgi:hypothetical protein
MLATRKPAVSEHERPLYNKMAINPAETGAILDWFHRLLTSILFADFVSEQSKVFMIVAR